MMSKATIVVALSAIAAAAPLAPRQIGPFASNNISAVHNDAGAPDNVVIVSHGAPEGIRADAAPREGDIAGAMIVLGSENNNDVRVPTNAEEEAGHHRNARAFVNGAVVRIMNSNVHDPLGSVMGGDQGEAHYVCCNEASQHCVATTQFNIDSCSFVIQRPAGQQYDMLAFRPNTALCLNIWGDKGSTGMVNLFTCSSPGPNSNWVDTHDMAPGRNQLRSETGQCLWYPGQNMQMIAKSFDQCNAQPSDVNGMWYMDQLLAVAPIDTAMAPTLVTGSAQAAPQVDSILVGAAPQQGAPSLL